MDEVTAKIHDSELKVLQALWANEGVLPLSELRRILADERGWEYSTVKTLLRRLQDKGAVILEQRGVYRALLSQNEYNRSCVRSLVDKVFSGSAKAFIAALISEIQLEETDIAELAELLREEQP